MNKHSFALHLCIILIIILTILGLLFIYSSSQFFSYNSHGSTSYYFFKQLCGVGLGIFTCLIVACIPFDFFKKNALSLLIFSSFLCLIPHMPFLGIKINGAARWIYAGFFFIQPVEILKPFFILMISSLITRNKYQLHTTLWSVISICIITTSILLLQPDFGQAVVLLLLSFIMFFTFYCKTKLLLLTSGIGASALFLIAIVKPYRLARLLIFLDPWKDPLGKGFQIIQSLIAIVNGSWLGVGIGKSTQKIAYLPMQHTDFIFSIICEEIGLIGASILIMLYAALQITFIYIAFYTKDMYAKLFIIGCALLIAFESSINIFVISALLPTKGIGLPFISYGVSSIIGHSIMLGILFSAYHHNNNQK